MPVAFIAVPVVAVLFLIARINGKINTNRILRVAPWQIVIFSLGMYLINLKKLIRISKHFQSKTL